MIEDCLGEIHVRVEAHFALEEHFMLDNNFKNYTHHKKEHDDFLAVIVDLIEKFRRSTAARRWNAIEFSNAQLFGVRSL